jgi:hypothetical protein
MTKQEKALADAVRECYRVASRWVEALDAMDALVDVIVAAMRPSIREEFTRYVHD